MCQASTSAREFRGKFLVRFALAELRRLGGDEHRRQRAARVDREERLQLAEHGAFVHVAHHDEDDVVGHVAGLVIGHQVVAGQRVE